MLLSIVMAARNSEKHIGEALGSIPASLGGAAIDYEILVADGVSSDETVAIAETFPNVQIVSRRDQGIYDGMNRGIAAAKGSYVAILNSDDLFEPDGVSAAVEALNENQNAGFCSGSVRFGRHHQASRLLKQVCPLSVAGGIFGVPAINARLYRRDLLTRAGPIRTDAGLGADREWLVRILKTGGPGLAIPDAIYFYRQHPGSKTLADDRDASFRIYAAEAQVMSLMMREANEDVELIRLARASYALADFKLWLRGGGRARKISQLSPELRILPIDLLRGFYMSTQWRGYLSGA